MEDYLSCLKELGLQGIYLSIDLYERERETLTPLLNKLGLTYIGFHKHLDLSHHPEDESYKKCIDLTVSSGANNILLVPGFIYAGEEEKKTELLENMISGMKKAVEYGKSRGIYVCMEDYDSPFAPFNCTAGLDYFFDRLPELRFAFDSGNFCYFSEDTVKSLNHFRDKLHLVHIKDRADTPFGKTGGVFTCKNGRKLYCVPAGTGEVRAREIIEELKRTGFDGPVIAELFGSDSVYEGLQMSLKFIKEIIK